MKKIKNSFHGGGDKNILVFSIGYVSSQRRKEMTDSQKRDLVAFFKNCKKDIDLFIGEVFEPVITTNASPHA